jgi:N-acetylglucosaminyldiphosphoundecaprenol N-acetyl-beta-D-mannosaminyltransferase
MDTKQIFGLNFLDVSLDKAASIVAENAAHGRRQQVYFVNAHCINVAARDREYRDILKGSPSLFADGVGMSIASGLFGNKLENNVNGTDLFPLICDAAVSNGISIGLLGAEPGVAAKCAVEMRARVPGLDIRVTEHGFLREEEEREAITRINDSNISILFVAKGVPAQERWINENFELLKVPVVAAVGALFDFYSGNVKRAPQLLRRLRLEWLYRLLGEPRRLFKRYVLGNPQFLLRAIWFRISGQESI